MTGDAPLRKQFAPTPYGRVAYLARGPEGGPPVLLVHGIPTSSFLWRHVMRFLGHDFRCIAPDLLGLGDSEVDPQRGRFDMDAQAEMLLALMDQLGYERFDLVCHDQGGAAGQVLVSRAPQRVRRLVLTDCVCYDNWPVPVIRRMQALLRVPLLSDWVGASGLMQWIETSTRLSAFRNGVFDRSRLSDEAIAEYLRPLREGPARREAMRQFVLAGHPRYTMTAIEALRRFSAPTLVIWAADDRYISPSWGVRLSEEIPGAGPAQLVPFCGHFWPEERPAEFASKIGDFLGAPDERFAAKAAAPRKPAAAGAESTAAEAVAAASDGERSAERSDAEEVPDDVERPGRAKSKGRGRKLPVATTEGA